MVGGGELTEEGVGYDATGQRGWQHCEQTHDTTEFDVTGRERLVGFVIPEGHGGVRGGPQPTQLFVKGYARAAEPVDGLHQDGGADAVAINESGRQPIEKQVGGCRGLGRLRRAPRELGSFA